MSDRKSARPSLGALTSPTPNEPRNTIPSQKQPERPAVRPQHITSKWFQEPRVLPATVTQRPNGASNSPSPPKPVATRPPPWTNDPELKVSVGNLPPGLGTLDIHRFLRQYGNVIRIEIQEPRRSDRTNAWVIFSPPPTSADWITRATNRANAVGSIARPVQIEALPHRAYLHKSPINPSRECVEEMKIKALQLDFGVMQARDSMLLLYTTKSSNVTPVEIVLNLQRKALDVNFAIMTERQPFINEDSPTQMQRHYKMRLNIAQLSEVVQVECASSGELAWVIPTRFPPFMYRKTDNVDDTHEAGTTLWTAWQTWYRQTEIDSNPEVSRRAPTQLQKDTAIVDIGRWLVYRLVFTRAVASIPEFIDLLQALKDHSVQVKSDRPMTFEPGKSKALWNRSNCTSSVFNSTSRSSVLSELHEMAEETVNLPFALRYQLDACISQGLLHETNINQNFLQRLTNMNVERATRLLEKVLDKKNRYYDPHDIFDDVLRKVSIIRKPTPSYCAIIRTATITPTTIYFNSPAVEPSNRIVRQFRQYEDRFLRVKFTDEKYRGRVMSRDDASMNEVYTRVKRTMTNGIKIGDRRYEFLAFGSSQLRECGAYFFASTSGLTAQDIRDKMGNFKHIKVVAKYCSRIGQCFSTTRATQIGVNIEKIPDIERNGFCFTDGVGMISPFLARCIAQEHGLPNTSTEFPSVFQFRLAGCKGVLAVESSLTKNTVQIRPSQEKFVAMQYRGLEICRISQLSAANLNVQVILVLSALGVGDHVFLSKMRDMLADLKEAMVDEKKAVELLSKNIDFNQMTCQLAQIILQGFMEVKDPFMISCLRLWRSWSIKYLKEKARIFVEDGAFVLGCVDETGILKGHFKHLPQDDVLDISSLPEIFLQVPDRHPDCEGKWRIIQGLCSLARNPSLHPGDVRVVRAVDAPALYHYKNCVVFPQTGDRDLANMCSGGDLDGDDYLVMWDESLMPIEWNHAPMDYTPPEPVLSDGPVTVDAMTSFFVTHMKHDNVARIATAHRYWADALPDGVKDPICLELAQLHSTAVDYAKTGVPAHVPKHLKVTRWPHWAEVKGRSRSKIYHSNRVLGRLYDEVQRVPFEPAWWLSFDKRILEAYHFDEETLTVAREAKRQYDDAVRRIMAKYTIKTEFEVWTTFVLEHSEDIGDYKFAETIGEAVHALKEHHQKLCYEMAGVPNKDRDNMRPFVAAMYRVTAEGMAAAMAQCNQKKLVGGRWLPAKVPTVESMPFMSFPWLFPHELGEIACKGCGARDNSHLVTPPPKNKPANKPTSEIAVGQYDLAPLEEVAMPKDAVDSVEAPNLFGETTDNKNGQPDTTTFTNGRPSADIASPSAAV